MMIPASVTYVRACTCSGQTLSKHGDEEWGQSKHMVGTTLATQPACLAANLAAACRAWPSALLAGFQARRIHILQPLVGQHLQPLHDGGPQLGG